MTILVIPSARFAADYYEEFKTALVGHGVRLWPDIGPAEEIEFVVAFRPEPGLLASLANLKCVFSQGAGVDGVLGDSSYPETVPLLRLVHPELTRQMTEFIVHQVLSFHRRYDDYRELQRQRVWHRLAQPQAPDTTIGILGLGALGRDAARGLGQLGFRIAGFSRTPKDIEGIECYAGEAELGAFLGACDILVVVLPLTAETENMIDSAFLAQLKPGASLINVARGKIIDDQSLVAALDSGKLSRVSLDVFIEEPLASDHPFWRHPLISVTPHVASITTGRMLADMVGQTIEQFGDDQFVAVDFRQGY